MSMKRSIGLIALLLGCSIPVQARTLSLQLGDIDGGIYGGAGSVDNVYVDGNWLLSILNAGWPGSYSAFDIAKADHNVPFTFLFSLEPGEIVAGATLTVGIRRTHTDVVTDEIFLESPLREDGGSYPFSDLGWLPVSTTVGERSMDLATALGRNILPKLQDGQLNVFIRDDSLVDYAILNLTIVPEPAVSSLLFLPAAWLCSRRRMRNG